MFAKNENGTYTRLAVVTKQASDAPANPYRGGYGLKIPTDSLALVNGKWQRVYVAQTGNSGAAWVQIKGERVLIEEIEAPKMPDLKPFEHGKWSAWQGVAQILLSDESVKQLREFPNVTDCINWLFLNGEREAARGLNAHYFKKAETEAPKESIFTGIKKGMALAFFGSAYADQADECGQPLRGEIMEQLPLAIDTAALHAADTLVNDLIAKHDFAEKGLNQSQCITRLYYKAQDCDRKGADRELTPELFGHYLAMQAMGTGVGLESFGDSVRDAIAVPYVEFGSHSLEVDYFVTPDEGDE